MPTVRHSATSNCTKQVSAMMTCCYREAISYLVLQEQIEIISPFGGKSC